MLTKINQLASLALFKVEKIFKCFLNNSTYSSSYYIKTKVVYSIGLF